VEKTENDAQTRAGIHTNEQKCLGQVGDGKAPLPACTCGVEESDKLLHHWFDCPYGRERNERARRKP
jgi:hypothetical protein